MSILDTPLFQGQRALVTGAASNIGRAIAARLAGEGAALTVTDIDGERLAELTGELDGKPRSVVADLSGSDGWRELWRAVETEPFDIFVHSASPKRHETDLAMTVSEGVFDAMLNTNLRSGFLLGRAVADAMIAQGRGGRLLYLTSLHADDARNLPHYSAAKAGTGMIVKELARALGPQGIRVNAIAPGAIPGGGFDTSDESFQPKRKIPLGRFGQADDIARAAMALLSDDFMGYVTGATLIVDGGLQLFNWIDRPDA